MDLRGAIERAERIDTKLRAMTEGLELIPTNRRRLAGAAFMVVLDIHAEMPSLVRRGNVGIAFILLRSIWEATVRGFWLLECATDDQIGRFIADTLGRKTWDMIADLENGSFDKATLSSIHSHNSRKLNAMNHIGGPLLVRYNSESGIEPNFDHEEIAECLANATTNALLSAIGLAQAAVNNEIAAAVVKIQADERWN